MTAAEFWRRLNTRATTRQPTMSAAIMRSYRQLADQMAPGEIEAYIRRGDVEGFVRNLLSEPVLNTAAAPLREALRTQVQDGVPYYGKMITIAPEGRWATIAFDFLNPRVIDAIREMESKVIGGWKTGVRDVARAFVENGLRDGVNPRTTARDLRSILGLSPTQEQAVANFRAALETGDKAKALSYGLRNRTFDAAIKRGELTPAQIDRMSEAYRKRMVAFNAETQARTASLDAQKLAQRLSWQDAVEKGVVDGSKLMKRWKGVMDDRERDEHIAMENETVPADDTFSNGEMTPGESTYNCRCVAIYFVARG